MDYKDVASNILSGFNKTELKTYEAIKPFDSVHLASMGHNDTEGYQIFTPAFIVNDMCAAVGNDILDFSKNVLEPTSGDGAFTVFILLKRLERALAGGNFETDSLKALSTIYSIEMDKELIDKQRNNIFTAVLLFVNDHSIMVSDGYFDVLKCIIIKNFMWAMFNSDNEVGSIWGTNVAYKMPEAEKGKLISLNMPVWEISDNNIDVHEEGVDL